MPVDQENMSFWCLREKPFDSYSLRVERRALAFEHVRLLAQETISGGVEPSELPLNACKLELRQD